MNEHVSQIPVVRIAMTYQLSKDNQLSFETYLAQDATLPEFNSVVDKLELIASRQMMKGTIASKIERKALVETLLRRATEDLQIVDKRYADKQEEWYSSGRKSAVQRAPKEKQEREALLQSIRAMEQERDQLTEQIILLEKTVAPDMPANS